MTGWTMFKVTAEKIRKTFPDPLEQATKLKNIVQDASMKKHVNTFQDAEDPITEFIELMEPRFRSKQFMHTELEKKIDKILKVDLKSTASTIMQGMLDLKAVLRQYKQKKLEIRTSAADDMAGKFRPYEERKIRAQLEAFDFDPALTQQLFEDESTKQYHAETAQANYDAKVMMSKPPTPLPR